MVKHAGAAVRLELGPHRSGVRMRLGDDGRDSTRPVPTVTGLAGSRPGEKIEARLRSRAARRGETSRSSSEAAWLAGAAPTDRTRHTAKET